MVTELIKPFGLDEAALGRAFRTHAGKGEFLHSSKIIHRSEECKNIFHRADAIAQARNASEITCLDLLQAILENPGSHIEAALKEFNVTAKDILRGAPSAKEPEERKVKKSRNTPVLDRFGTDLTILAEENRLDPIIGRRDELLQVIRTLTRKQKSNPLIIGDPGVGKTAIVRGLAQRIAKQNLAHSLRDKRIIEINMGSLVAGSKMRGEFEERLIQIIKEVSQNPEIILFIDEIHTVIGAGRVDGGLDASNILKPALASDEIHCIGATTNSEFRRYFEKDPALERRFQPIWIHEPTIEDSILILLGLKKQYEEHHKVTIPDSVVKAAVELSVRYLPDRRLPDKALDLLDEACARKKVPVLSMAPGISEFHGTIGDDDIAEVIEKWTGIPVLTRDKERERFMKMENLLRERVIGQDDALRKIADKVRIAKSGLQDPSRPLCVFLFLGPTGVGKTEAVKALAEFLFGTDDAMIRLDMSEFSEKHSVSKLVGSPPGYVGYEEEGQLTGALRRRPYSVVLMDEIEKAHPEIFDIFLQVFDDGRLTDAKGRTADAKNAIFIMTSNVQISDSLSDQIYMSFGGVHSKTAEIRKDLIGTFRPEFVNRIDEIIIFSRLKQDDIEKIARILVGRVKDRLLKKGMNLVISPDVIRFLAAEGYDETFGARPLRRTIAQNLEEPLSRKIISGEFKEGDSIAVKILHGDISIMKIGKKYEHPG
jgi:ATP-dependent Clp protease ATP-binding subunit ClpC